MRILESVADWLLLKGDEDFSPPPKDSEVGVVGASTIGTENNEKNIYSIFWYISQVLTEIIHDLQDADNLKLLSYIIVFSYNL